MATEVGAIYYTVDARTQALLKAEKDVDNSSRRMEKRFDKTDRASRRMSSGFDNAGSAALRLRNIVTAVSSAMAVRQIIAYSDAWGRAQNQLRQVTSGAAELRDINQQLMDISNRSAVSFENTAGLYARVAQATRNLNIEQSQLIEFVDLTSQSMRAYGTSAAGAAALTLQLSQAFNAGMLQGEEFNTIMDQAPLLLEALQNETGKTSRELKKMGSEGKLGIDLLIRSVRNYSDEIKRRAGASTDTFADSLTKARNNMIAFVGSSDSAQGVVGKLGESAVYLSNNLELVTNAAIVLAAVIAGKYANALGAGAIAQLSLAVATIKQATADRQAALASNEAVAASLRKAQASVAAAQSTIREIEADRAALAATLSNNQAQGVQIAIKRELAVMDHALAQAKERLVVRQQAETQSAALATAAHRANAVTLTATTVAARAATLALGGLKFAFALLGGPAGAILIAAWALYTFWDRLNGTAQAAQKLDDRVKELVGSTEDLTRAQLENKRADLAASLVDAHIEAEKLNAEVEDLQQQARSESIRFQGRPGAATTRLNGPTGGAGESARLTELNREIEASEQAIELLGEKIEQVGVGTGSGNGGSSAGSEAKRRQNELSAVQRQLATERETIEREYRERNRIIRESTAEGSQQQIELLERSAAERESRQQQITERLLSGLRTETEEIKAEYERRRQEILDATAPGAEQDDLLERNRKAREREVGDFIGGSPDPLTGGQYDDQFSRYDQDAEREKERYQSQLDRLVDAREQQLLTQEDYNKREQEAAQAHADRLQQIEQSKASMMISTAGNMFGEMASVARGFAGEQSGIYRAMFAASKAFAIADAAIKIQQGIANAAALPFPQNLAAIASTMSATTSIIGNIQSVSMAGGRLHGGNVTAGNGYRVTEDGKPELLTQGTQQYLIPGRNGKVTSNGDMGGTDRGGNNGGGSVMGGGNISIHIHNEGKDMEVDRTESRTGAGGLREMHVFVRNSFKGMMRDGSIDKDMNLNYGINRRGR